jgi:putative membrane protein (TIGR04086 family)
MVRKTTSKTSKVEKINFLILTKAIILAYIITIPVFIVLALIATYTKFPEKLILPAVIVTTIISILIASSASTSNLKSKGWLNGSLVGLTYMIVLYLVSSIVFKNFSINEHVITNTVIGVLTGAIGGIIGINIKR